jgi:competence protein ComEC
MVDVSTFTDIINSYLPEPHASLLNGIIFGVPLKTDRTFYEQVKIVGLLHIVVLSGSNISILGAIVGSITERLGKKISILLTIGTIIVFICFVGFQAPIVRAGIMGILSLTAILLGRKSIALYTLFLSALGIAIFWPTWITTISFQLSFAATLGIILFGNIKTAKKKKKNIDKNEIWEYIKKDLQTSLAAQIFTVPIIWIYFKQISFISPLANVMIFFIIAPLMIFGFLTAVLGKMHFALGIIPSYLCYALLSYVIFVIEILSKVPFAFISF